MGIIIKYNDLLICREEEDGTIVCDFGKEIDEQILRKSIIAELEAINMYEGFASVISNEKVRKVLKDVANEEKVHVGEFLELLLEIDKKQVNGINKGKIEVMRID